MSENAGLRKGDLVRFSVRNKSEIKAWRPFTYEEKIKWYEETKGCLNSAGEIILPPENFAIHFGDYDEIPMLLVISSRVKFRKAKNAIKLMNTLTGEVFFTLKEQLVKVTG